MRDGWTPVSPFYLGGEFLGFLDDAHRELIAGAPTIAVGRGFVHHPQLAPFISNIAVFHQLHCLVSTRHPPLLSRSRFSRRVVNSWISGLELTSGRQHGIRVTYYTALHRLGHVDGTASAADDAFLEAVGARTDPEHMRHCFDYLRRALMCAADTNLEAVSRETRVTTGWGSRRVCRDYAAVKAWAEEWRNSSDTGIL